MTAAATFTRALPPSKPVVFGAQGFDENEDHLAHPVRYASRLVRYLGCDSTVRVRVIEQFGRAPSRAVIATLRQRQREAGARELARCRVDEPSEGDARGFRPGSLVGIDPWPTARQPLPARLPMSWLEIVAAIARAHGLTAGALIGRSRVRPVARVRNLTFAVLHARGNDLATIGHWMGGRSHATVHHCIQSFCEKGRDDRDLRATWDAIFGAPVITSAGLLGHWEGAA